MASEIIVALDAMGGDHAPDMVLDGAAIALTRFPQARFLLFGIEDQIAPRLAKLPALAAVSRFVPAETVVSGETKPGVALRSGRRSSMRLAIDAVVAGDAHCVVSAGNTGALMAMAKVAMKTLPGIDRPAIATFLPTQRGESVMLDLGANIEVDAANLVQFAVMGQIFSRTVLGVVNPTVGLLNVGSEDLKGSDVLRQAHSQLRAMEPQIAFHGFIEGDDILAGTVDVVVTDGFTGNVALKVLEGTAKMFGVFLRAALNSSWLARIGYLATRPALAGLRKRLDPRRYNGAILLGLQGITVKSHGGSDALAFANAVGVAVDMKANGFIEIIRSELALATPVATAAAAV